MYYRVELKINYFSNIVSVLSSQELLELHLMINDMPLIQILKVEKIDNYRSASDLLNDIKNKTKKKGLTRNIKEG